MKNKKSFKFERIGLYSKAYSNRNTENDVFSTNTYGTVIRLVKVLNGILMIFTPVAMKFWQDRLMRLTYIGSLILLMNMGGCVFAPLATSAMATATTSTFIETTAVSGASYLTTGKGVSEHFISGAVDQDCKLYNVIEGKAVCQNYQIDKIPQRDLTTKFTTGNTASTDVIEDFLQQSSREK
jgi:hypothetical protein